MCTKPLPDGATQREAAKREGLDVEVIDQGKGVTRQQLDRILSRSGLGRAVTPCIEAQNLKMRQQVGGLGRPQSVVGSDRMRKHDDGLVRSALQPVIEPRAVDAGEGQAIFSSSVEHWDRSSHCATQVAPGGTAPLIRDILQELRVSPEPRISYAWSPRGCAP